MALDIIRGNITQIHPTNDLIENLQKIITEEDEATLYLGYPLTANADSKITIDALLMSREKGLIAFVFPRGSVEIEHLKEEQDTLYYHLDYNFKKYPSLRKGRGLSFDPVVISWLPISDELVEEGYIFSDASKIERDIEELTEFDSSIYPRLSEALQKVSNIKPRKKRENVNSETSRGGVIKKIEAEIANLDRWQKKAALEIPDGPQRIRGLAGSGKTIVLALKAAYLHSEHPEWKIAVTFYTRSLAQQYEDLIIQFCNEFTGEKPNWDNLHIVHAWGTNQEPGIYSIASSLYNVLPVNYSNAQAKYGRKDAFEGICNDLTQYFGKDNSPIYDAILIDEAQDLPQPFFKICHQIIKYPKRIIWAYDELQNLNETIMPSVEDMFGVDQNGNLNISLESKEDEAQRDIILPVCYRNPPWTLSLAHSIGFGIYRNKSKVQMFDDLGVWEDIGYKVEAGSLEYGSEVTLARKIEAAPSYFRNLITPQDSVYAKSFVSESEQYKWIADQIEINLTQDELDPDDILVIFPDAYYSKSEYVSFRSFLLQKQINSVLVGVNTNRDIFRVQGSVSCSGIYRAKGNEAPMVYVVNSNYCAEGPELIKLRNILFTAITRSRGWVRICGVGEYMDLLQEEINKCISENHFQLKFTVPTLEELQQLRRIHRERTEEELKKHHELQGNVKNIIAEIESGDFDLEMIPELEALLNLVKQSKQRINDEEI